MDQPKEEIRYSPHARRRMRQRRIPEELVEDVLANPDQRRPAMPLADHRPAEIFTAERDGRLIKVYVEIGREPTYVKTVARSRRIYRREGR
ncbi:MAG: DUF4258 domain-containing protein [Dehalococcoidia bacterium]|nr:DUF4258 domain-containing protein [Dehalococcoidia bacterium]